MLSKKITITNFAHNQQTQANCFRPENEKDVTSILLSSLPCLTRGQGLSYNDSCLPILNENIIDPCRLNNFISFDKKTGIVVAQAFVKFIDLFCISDEYIPPIIPGTLFATLAGGVAHDVHGKNNSCFGSLGEHLVWLELQLPNEILICSRTQNTDLFYATIGGAGLTGIITKVAFKLIKKSRTVAVQTEKYQSLNVLINRILEASKQFTYQVAWLNLLHPFDAILELANHCEELTINEKKSRITIPKLPINLIRPTLIKCFNKLYYKFQTETVKIKPLMIFNNPLDQHFKNWSNFYGKLGFVQFQAVFPVASAEDTIDACLNKIKKAGALPALTTLKFFSKQSLGLLSFCQPGFTLTIDFPFNTTTKNLVPELNKLITVQKGKVYLAKDLFLDPQQFALQYPAIEKFQHILQRYNYPMLSKLSQRLGITP